MHLFGSTAVRLGESHLYLLLTQACPHVRLRFSSHCEKGMVFAVNPTASKSFEAFQAAAMKTTANTTSNGTSSGSSGSSTATDSASTSTSTSTKANGAAALEVRNVVTLLGAAGMVAGLLL